MWRAEPPRRRAARVFTRAMTNVMMNPTSSTNSGRLGSSSTSLGKVAKRKVMTLLLSAAPAAPNHRGPARRRQSDEAEAEGLAEGDSLGVSEPGGSQSALMAL